jgi:hypothetical protein
MVTYAEAISVETAEQIQTRLLDDLAADGVIITGFSPTSAERGLVALDARALAYEQAIRAEVAKSVLLVAPNSRDQAWVDRKVEGFFKVSRLLETYAIHIFTLTNQAATGGPYVIKPRQLRASSVGGIEFINTTGGTLEAGVGKTLPLQFEAVTPGIVGNIGPGDIFAINGGALPAVDISNAPGSLITAARDRETNLEYVTRAYGRWGTLAAGGHPSAVEFRILSGVETITKLGVRDDNPNGPGTVDVYLANASGPATTQECTLAAAVFGPYEPLGSRGLWRYLPATARTLTVEATFELDGTNPDAIANAELNLLLLQAQWPMEAGKKLDENFIRGILTGGEYETPLITGFSGVSDVDVVSTLDDIVLDVAEVLVIVPILSETP